MIKNYFKIVLRNIRKQPAHTLLNLSCLTIGIAGALFILLYLHFELTYDKFHAKAANIFKINTNAIKTHEKTIDVTWVNTPATLGPTLEKEITGVENYTRIFQFWTSPDVKLWFDENQLDVTDVYAADPSVFDMFSFNFVSGSPEEALEGPDKIVISESLANRLFGDADPMGKIISSSLPKKKTGDSQLALVVTGVYRDMPKNTHLFIEALISSSTDRSLEDYYFNEFNVYTYLLLHPQTDVDQLAASLTGIYVKHVDPVREPVLISASHNLVRVTDIHIEATGGYTYIYIFGAVGILLLIISGISYVNLATAQVSRRSLEIGLRKVMGSQRNQLISQFLGESIVLTSIAAVAAILIVILTLGSLNEMLSINLSLSQLWTPQLVLGMVTTMILLGVLGGSYPAFFLASIEPIKAIKDKVERKAPLRKALVSVQLAVVIFVLVSTGMIYEQLQYLRNKDLGFDREQIVNVTMPDQGKNDLSQYEALKNSLLKNTSISGVCTSDFIPGKDDMGRRPIAIDGSRGQEQKFVYWGRFDYDFLSTMSIAIRSGRNFSPDFPGDTSAIIVNEALVRAFNLKEPLGGKVRFGGKGNPNFFVIVGVVSDFHQSTLYTPIEPQMYLLRPGIKLFVKVAKDIPGAIRHVEQTWRNFYADSPFAYRFIDDELQDGYKGDQVRGKVFFLLSLLTIFIAFLGLFGLASYLAMQRVKEIGIRKVLGASMKDTALLITKDFLLLVILAAIPAFGLAWYMIDRWLENFAFRTEINYSIFILSLLFTLLLTLATTGLHALRAASINPLKNLRSE